MPASNLANGTLCDTRNPSNINLSASFTRETNNELQYFTWNMAWHCPNLQYPHQKVQYPHRWNSNESNPIRPSTNISHWLLMNLLIQSCMKCIPRQFLTQFHSSHFYKLQPRVSKSITANTTHVAVTHCIYGHDKNLFCFYFTLSRAFQRL